MDCPADDPKNERGKNGEDGISIKMLKEVIASSMCSYSEFVHADKIEACTFFLMGIHGLDQVILQHPSDTELLTEIRSILQKVCRCSLAYDDLYWRVPSPQLLT